MIYGMITFKRIFKLAGLCGVILLSSCNQIVGSPEAGTRDDLVNGSFYYNGMGIVYDYNPIIASGNESLSRPDMSDYVRSGFVTENSYLKTECFFDNGTETSTISGCFQVLNDRSADQTPLQSKYGAWGYDVGSDEFYQVNSFYHANKIIKRFNDALSDAHGNIHFNGGNLLSPATKYDFENTASFWLADAVRDPNDYDTILGIQSELLTIYSKCYLDQLNASYSPASNELCLGYNDDSSWFFMAQDPSIIYHEMGHVLVKAMMNQRNVSFSFPNYHVAPFQSDLGVLFYDEAGAINEGIADWFSYFMNGRTRIGEWGIGKINGSGGRPLSEDDELHNGVVSKLPGERLSYPSYLYYDPANPTEEYEDVHYAGQIVSHYLTSLTEELKGCYTTTDDDALHEQASDLVLMLLNETLAELGDMTARGSDIYDDFRMTGDPTFGGYFVNLNGTEAYRWAHQVNPPNFRKFFQVLAKNIQYKISYKLCPSFTKDESEKLLDEYGLLLFDSYNEVKKGVLFTDMGTYIQKTDTDEATYFYSLFTSCSTYNSFYPTDNFCPLFASSSIDVDNRVNTDLIYKDLIEYPSDMDDVSAAFLVDNRSDIESIIAQLTFEGAGVQTSDGLAGVEYNNNNLKISPGEIVGLAINLYNNSNSTIGGAQILANDWDHMKLYDSADTYVNRIENTNAGLDIATWIPCTIDDWPTADENGASDDDPSSPVEGDCGYPTRDNFIVKDDGSGYHEYYQDAPQPVCIVQYSNDNETQWVSQDFYRNQVLSLESEECLNSPAYSGDEFNPNECLIRMLPGADQSTLGKIEPQKTWSDTLVDSASSEGLTLSSNNVVLMEVNKNIAPGTTFACRLRARFTNCADCYTDPDTGEEYTDYDMAGGDPFKIINFKFTVID